MPSRFQKYKSRVSMALHLTEEEVRELAPVFTNLFSRGYSQVAAVAYLKQFIAQQAGKAASTASVNEEAS